jgi:hypothetical protein
MLPGAQLQEVDGDEYRGVVKVKVGPITAQYKGTATIVEEDENTGRVVIKASGRDTRGQGNASATISATMSPDGDGTKVTVVTDLTVTGKVAQFGRGVMADVSTKLMGQFVDALQADLEGSKSAPEMASEAGEEAATPVESNGSAAPQDTGPRRIESPEAEPVDLLAVAGGSTFKRLAPVIGVVLLFIVILARRRGRRR